MSGTLPEWIARWLGVDASSGQVTSWRLEHVWPWPAWATVLFVVAIAAMVSWVYSREAGAARRPLRLLLALLRTAVIAVVLLMIAGWNISLERKDLPYVAVLMDASQSMRQEELFQDETVREAILRRAGTQERPFARCHLANLPFAPGDGDLLAELSERFRLKFYRVAEDAREIPQPEDGWVAALEELRPDGAESRLASAVRQVLDDLRGSPLAAIVLVSDGLTTEGKSLADVAGACRRQGVPLFTIGPGVPQPRRDVALTELAVREEVFAGEAVRFDARITAWGFDGAEAEVTLRNAAGDRLARETVQLGGDGTMHSVGLVYELSEPGEHEFFVEVSARGEEPDRANNVRRARVTVHKRQLRVLLVQGEPSYEFRFLKHMFERDRTVELKTVLQAADREYVPQDKSALNRVPVSLDELAKFDVIILGDVDPAQLGGTAMEAIAQFVRERAGGLIMIAGPRFGPAALRGTPLEMLAPIDVAAVRVPKAGESPPEGFRAVPTPFGLQNPAMLFAETENESRRLWSALPELYWMIEAPRLRPGAVVLVEHATAQGPDGRKLPLVVSQYVGAGRVLLHTFDGTYRWRGVNEDRFFGRYWVQTVRDLARLKLLGSQQRIELSTDRRAYRHGEPVRLRLRFFSPRDFPAEGSEVRVALDAPGGREQQVQLDRDEAQRGVYSALVSGLGPGEFRARLVSPGGAGRLPTAEFIVEPPRRESDVLPIHWDELATAAKESGGRLYTIMTASSLARDLPAGRQVARDRMPSTPLWNRWPIVALVVGLLIAEWALRKRNGML